MNRAFIVFLFFFGLIVSVASFAQAPKVQGQGSSSGVYSPNILVPNQTATKINGTTSLLETGNNNLLANPSLEAPLVSGAAPSWSTPDATLAIETTDAFHGKQALKATYSAKPVNLYQSSALNASAFVNGANGVRSTAVKTSITYTSTLRIYVCGVYAGVLKATSDGTSITDCKEVNNNGSWGEYVYASQLGATSNGIAVVSLNPTTGALANVTGDVFIDKAEVSQTNRAMNVGICDSIECTTEFSASIDGAGAVSSENVDWINGNCSNVSSHFTCSLNASLGLANKLNCTVTPTDSNNGNLISSKTTGSSSSAFSYVTIIGSTKINNPVEVICQKTGSDYAAAIAKRNKSFLTDTASSFSTNTNPLYFKATAITDSDPVGTFNTYSYAANTNTKTICGTAPTQSIADMKANGIQIFTRAHNAASTCGNPARVEVKSGTGMANVTPRIYLATSKESPGSLDFAVQSTAIDLGAKYNHYSEKSGVIVIDVGDASSSTNTSHFLIGSGLATTSGYLVINAQKAKDTMVADLKDVAYSEGSGGVDIQSVFFGNGAGCSGVCSTGTCTICSKVGGKITSVSWVSAGRYNLNGIDGTKYVCSGTGGLNASPWTVAIIMDKTSSSTSHTQIAGNGTNSLLNSVTCIGTK